MAKVIVVHDPAERIRTQLLEEKAKELMRIRSSLGIPSYSLHGTRIGGLPIASSDGVAIQVGHDWEKDSFNNQEINRLRRPPLKLMRRYPSDKEVIYNWRYPSVILLKATARGLSVTLSEQRAERISQWVYQLVQVARQIGLKDKDFKFGHWRVELTL